MAEQCMHSHFLNEAEKTIKKAFAQKIIHFFKTNNNRDDQILKMFVQWLIVCLGHLHENFQSTLERGLEIGLCYLILPEHT
jgi:hypothetical protein